MSQERSEARELTPIQKFWDSSQGMKDYRPHVQRVEDEENAAAEEAMQPVPKDESAQESADLSDSSPPAAPPESETPALPLGVTPTEPEPDADKENGKGNESSGVAPSPPTAPPPPPVPGSSSPSSSSPTNPGKNTPPAVTKPPTSG